MEVLFHCPARTLLTEMVSDLPLAPLGRFSGKSPRMCRRWRLFLCAHCRIHIDTRNPLDLTRSPNNSVQQGMGNLQIPADNGLGLSL